MWSLSSHNLALRMHVQFFLYITNQNSKTNMTCNGKKWYLGERERERERERKGVRKWVNIYPWRKRTVWDFLLTLLLNSKQAIDDFWRGRIWRYNAGDISRGKRWLVSVKEEKELGQKMKLRGSINRGKGNGMDGVDLEK